MKLNPVETINYMAERLGVCCENCQNYESCGICLIWGAHTLPDSYCSKFEPKETEEK